MHIEISLPRPGLLLLAIAAVSGWTVALGGFGTPAAVQADIVGVTQDTHVHTENVDLPDTQHTSPAEGGDNTIDAQKRMQDEERATQAREEQNVLRAKEDILRFQIQRLQEERDALGTTVDPVVEEQFRSASRLLVSLLQDQAKAEQFIRAALSDVWDAESKAKMLADAPANESNKPLLIWPVEPLKGISAFFLDKSYEERFKMKHYAIDIPVPQGTDVVAAAGGIVEDVVDRGLGANTITIRTPGGYSMLYMHLSAFNVQKGQHVVTGDVIGKSGGLPGTKGAGFSTGPHLHFGLFIDKQAVDPLPYLPEIEGIVQ
jgi:murein DD-endopeptidase MepM/ murein hydrolase activator NlpD